MKNLYDLLGNTAGSKISADYLNRLSAVLSLGGVVYDAADNDLYHLPMIEVDLPDDVKLSDVSPNYVLENGTINLYLTQGQNKLLMEFLEKGMTREEIYVPVGKIMSLTLRDITNFVVV